MHSKTYPESGSEAESYCFVNCLKQSADAYTENSFFRTAQCEYEVSETPQPESLERVPITAREKCELRLQIFRLFCNVTFEKAVAL